MFSKTKSKLMKFLKNKHENKSVFPSAAGEGARAKNEKLSIQKVYLPFGISPSQFSIVLGIAPCNHKCLFCPQSVEKPSKKHWLDLSLLGKVLHELPTKNITINVASYSETMQNPILFDSLEMMKRCRPELPIVLATNGTLITEDHTRRLVDIGLDMLSFSFDAADRESYRILMQADDFGKAERNLEMVCRIRSELNSKMKILTHIMAFENQKEGFAAFKSKWEPLVDSISFRAVGNWGDERLRLKERLAEKGFIPIYKKPERRYPCTSVFMHIKLAPDGFYYPCVAYVPKNEFSELQGRSLGNAKEITFREAWEMLEGIRQKQLSGKWDDCAYCKSCDVWGLWENMWLERDGEFDVDESIKGLNFWQ